MTNDFPRLGIVTADLVAEVERLLVLARDEAADLGAVNWADLGVVDVEYRLSMLDRDASPRCVVTVYEASPDAPLGRWLNAPLGRWLNERLDQTRFPNTFVECEW